MHKIKSLKNLLSLLQNLRDFCTIIKVQKNFMHFS